MKAVGERALTVPDQGDLPPSGPEIERWLIEKVAPTYDAVEADPGRTIPAEEVFAEIRARRAARLKDKA